MDVSSTDLDAILERWKAAASLGAADAKALLADTARTLCASNVAVWAPRGDGLAVLASGYKLYEKQGPLLANAARRVRADGAAFVTEEIFEDERIDESGVAPELNAKGTGVAAVRFGEGPDAGVVMAIFHRCPPLPFVEPGPPIPDETVARLERLAGVAGALARAIRG